MGCDENNIFQGAKMGVTIQMKEIVAPFMIGIHYFVYQKHLAILVLSKFCLVVELEVLLQAIYVFFFSFT